MKSLFCILAILFTYQLLYSVGAEYPEGGIDVSATVQVNLPKPSFMKVSYNVTYDNGKIYFDGFPIPDSKVAALHFLKDVVIHPNSEISKVRPVNTQARVLLRIQHCYNGLNTLYNIEQEIAQIDKRSIKQLKVERIFLFTDCHKKPVAYYLDSCHYEESAIHRINRANDKHYYYKAEEPTTTKPKN